MVVEVRRHSFTVDEFAKMGEAGIFTEDDLVELIDGEIRERAPIGSLHAGVVNRLNARLVELLGHSAIVGVQNPLQLDLHNEPQPDIAILAPRDDYYTTGHPEPGDTLLVIEVSDSSLAYDLHEKGPRYARSMIRELWVVAWSPRLSGYSRDRGRQAMQMSALLPEARRLHPRASKGCVSMSMRSSGPGGSRST